MTKDNESQGKAASWLWFAVPAGVIAAVALIVAATTVFDTNGSANSDGGRVRVDDLESGAEPPRAPDPFTGTVGDIEDGLVRAGRAGGAELLVQPTRLASAGFEDFVITGTGWASPPPVFILACGPEVVLFDIQDPPASCALDELTPTTPRDGNFEAVITYDAPSGGFTIVASDPTGTEWAVEFIQVR